MATQGGSVQCMVFGGPRAAGTGASVAEAHSSKELFVTGLQALADEAVAREAHSRAIQDLVEHRLSQQYAMISQRLDHLQELLKSNTSPREQQCGTNSTQQLFPKEGLGRFVSRLAKDVGEEQAMLRSELQRVKSMVDCDHAGRVPFQEMGDLDKFVQGEQLARDQHIDSMRVLFEGEKNARQLHLNSVKELLVFATRLRDIDGIMAESTDGYLCEAKLSMQDEADVQEMVEDVERCSLPELVKRVEHVERLLYDTVRPTELQSLQFQIEEFREEMKTSLEETQSRHSADVFELLSRIEEEKGAWTQHGCISELFEGELQNRQAHLHSMEQLMLKDGEARTAHMSEIQDHIKSHQGLLTEVADLQKRTHTLEQALKCNGQGTF
mmetsp:Transcript_47585/g.92020  ORF Transcript_47585/g.92020 Transcript_47585/m.92020 type:complete len:383 (-) Transcript_47585:21-1169(-)